MTARTHDAFAFASLLTVAAYYPPGDLNVTTMFACFVGNIVGALIPDMDQASNRLWDLLPAGDFLGRLFRRIFLKHRTISHSLLGAFILYRLLEWLLPNLLNTQFININAVFVSIMVGYVSHLLADAMTKEGIPLFFPLSFTVGIPPLRFLRVTTDTWVEHLVVLPAVAGYIVWFIHSHQTEFLRIVELMSA